MRAEGSGSSGVPLDRPASAPARYAVFAVWLILVVVVGFAFNGGTEWQAYKDQRIVTSMESGLAAAQARVQTLQPAPAPEAAPEA